MTLLYYINVVFIYNKLVLYNHSVVLLGLELGQVGSGSTSTRAQFEIIFWASGQA